MIERAASTGLAERPEAGAAPPAFLAACRCQPTTHTPVWILRQAGRYLPEYRALRERHDFLTLMRTPELAAEVTLQPVRRFPLDAAVLFADIMTPLDGLGLGLRFAPGPFLERPVRSVAAVEAFGHPRDVEHVAYVAAAIRLLREQLPASAPLIGFAGAPFTLFCYLVEGRAAKGFATARSFFFAEPEASALLLDRLADLSLAYLRAQAEAGVQALMLFDSWAGLLDREDYVERALPPVRRILEGLADLGVPRIYFPHDGARLLRDAAELPLEVLGVDWRMPLGRAREIAGEKIAVQGNLDPLALFAPDSELDRRVDRILFEAGAAPGHIFNLGHGIEPATDVAKVARVIERVQRRTARAPA